MFQKRLVGWQVEALAKKLFDTPNTHGGRYTCIVPEVMADYATLGELLTYEYNPCYKDTNLMVFWGANPDGNTPAMVRKARAAHKKGAQIIVVDPRPIPMAKKADVWLPIRPGTDAALGLAFLNVIINEELYDKDFTENYTSGFDKLKAHVQAFPPEWAAPITWLKVEDIYKAARLLGKVRPWNLYARCGSVSQQINSSQNARTMACLLAITGNIDVPGGNTLYFKTFTDAMFLDTYPMRIAFRPSPKANKGFMGAGKYPMMHFTHVCDMPGTVRGMHDGTVRGMWIVANNLVVAEQDSRKVYEGLKKIDLVVVPDFFMTPTAELADYVLPPAHYAELDNIVGTFLEPHNYATAFRKAVEPPEECWDDRKMLLEVARKAGREMLWEDVEDFHDFRLKYLNMTFDEACNLPDGKIEFPKPWRRYETSDPPFNTPSGKVELYSTVFEAIGVPPLPTFIENPISPVSTPEIFKEYPFIYMHIRVPSFEHTEGRQIERQRKMRPDPIMEINPDAAGKLGIKEGDWVKLEVPTPKFNGKYLKFRARFVPGMIPSVVGCDHGWWFPEMPAPEHGFEESNINALLSLESGPYEPLVGNIQCRAFACKVTKLE
ncbi:MAG: molybdopterin-dependent oxidoreductase [Desulfobacteraceae bacterium]|nr:molybdopterin-dependent oxidoreductase [Desulfobacteraceae bacterium]